MVGAAKWCDSSISVTYMLPESTKWEEVAEFIVQAHKKELKSIAVFPDRKMYGIISFLPFKELATNHIKEGVVIHQQNFSEDEIPVINQLNSNSSEFKILILLASIQIRIMSMILHQFTILEFYQLTHAQSNFCPAKASVCSLL